jgi:hypothetical protein
MLVGTVPSRAAPATASGYDIVVHYLRLGLRALLVLGLVLALAGFLAGRSESAVGIRHWTSSRLRGLRGGSSAGPVSTWVRAHVRGLRIGAVVLAVLAFVFVGQPTGITILVIAALLLLLLGLIEFLAGPADAPPGQPDVGVAPAAPAGPPAAAVVPPAPREGQDAPVPR